MENEILKARRDALDDLFERHDADEYDIAEHAIDLFIDYLEEYIRNGAPALPPHPHTVVRDTIE